MRKLALITGLSLATVAIAGLAGLAAAAVVDLGSAVVIAVVVALGLVTIALIERTHRRGGRVPVATTHELVGAADTHRALDELRAASVAHRTAGSPAAGHAHSAVSHALRSV